MKKQKILVTLIIYLNAVVLSISAIAKAISASSEGALLAVSDPLFAALTNRQVMLGVALLEGICIACLLIGKSLRIKALMLMWLTSAFALYKIGLHLIDFRGYCACLGNLFHWAGISTEMASRISLWLLISLITSSCMLLIISFTLEPKKLELAVSQ